MSDAFELGTEVSERTHVGEALSIDSFAWLEFLVTVEDRYDVFVLERIAADPPQTLGDLAELIADEANTRDGSGVNKQEVDE